MGKKLSKLSFFFEVKPLKTFKKFSKCIRKADFDENFPQIQKCSNLESAHPVIPKLGGRNYVQGRARISLTQNELYIL